VLDGASNAPGLVSGSEAHEPIVPDPPGVGLLLAGGAVVRCTPADDGALDDGATGVAGLAGAAKDLHVHVHAALLAVRILVVAKASTAALDTQA